MYLKYLLCSIKTQFTSKKPSDFYFFCYRWTGSILVKKKIPKTPNKTLIIIYPNITDQIMVTNTLPVDDEFLVVPPAAPTREQEQDSNLAYRVASSYLESTDAITLTTKTQVR